MLKKNLLLLIAALGLFLRFYHLGLIPPSLDWDETAHGYNAYSILKTGKDEYGYKMPLFFRSFDDYKPPLYTYLVVPSVAVFGLNDFAVRFPSALIGVLAVIFTYLMVYELFNSKKIAYFAAFFLAVSPWHLQFSRVAFETNSATFFSLLGTWAFLRALKAKNINITLWFSLTAITFGLSLYLYHNIRVFIPVYSLCLAVIYFRDIKKILKHLAIPIIIGTLFIIPLFSIVTSVSGLQRFEGTSVFSDKSPLYKASQQLLEDEQKGQGFIGKIIHNRRLVYVPIVAQNYLSHLRPTFLFITADMNRHHAPLVGLLYIWDIPFLLSGVYFLFSKNFFTKSKLVISSWFLLAPVAASVTWGVPHALRSEIFLPTFQIFTAIGFVVLLKNIKYKFIVAPIVIILLMLNFAFYLYQYHVHMSYEFSKDWLYGRKEAVQITELLKPNYDQVIVSTALEQPHEFWLYYTKYDPKKYLSEGGTASGGFLETRNHFDKYKFKPIDFTIQKGDGTTLFVGTPSEFPSSVKSIQKIYYLNGEPAIYIVDGNEN